jgi:transposase
MEGSVFLPLPSGLQITRICQDGNTVVVEVCSQRRSACCPVCAQVSDALHSRYHRTLRDVPCGGQSVRLHLTVGKFFCQQPECARQIFTERFPDFVEPWAQMTIRLNQALQSIGLATSGKLGMRLAARLGIPTSWMTILRRIMALASPERTSVTVLGIDDFSFQRGRRFGTILVDLQRHRMIDLLGERSPESSADWMRGHPEIDYVSRDRGKVYAQGASDGAPQATQIADRFHIMHNLVEAIEPVVTRCYNAIGKALPLPPTAQVPHAKEWRPAPDPAQEQQRLTHLAKKQHQYGVMLQLQQLGIPQPEIARRLGVTTRTLQNWKKRGVCPGTKRRRKRRSSFDPHAAYVLSRWKQGCRNVTLLWNEIRERGFRGSIRLVYRYLKTLKQQSVELPTMSVLSRVSVREAVWLIARSYPDLDPEERANLAELCQANQELTRLHEIVQAFGQMVRYREGHRLDEWKQQVTDSGIAEVQRFAKGLESDHEAVLAGLTLPYSNGMVEGFVNKLKLIKRIGYGRAGFPLLRQRVLHAL